LVVIRGSSGSGKTALLNIIDGIEAAARRGITVSAAAKWLGHDPAMTLRVYGHVYDDALASAGDVLFGGMSPANGER
jgi:ABC-type molybdate transport system ATPase subunit